MKSITWTLTILNLSICTAKQPHIVMILADDLGWNDISFHGSSQIPTPNIDKLAYNGVILNNYYVQPICTPTRSALMTGRYPIHTGMQYGVIVGSQKYGLPLNITTVPDVLKNLGYSNHAVGKWHLGFHAKEYTPTYRGFESFYGYYQGMGDYYTHTYNSHQNDDLRWGLDFRYDEKGVLKLLRNGIEGNYSTHLLAKRACDIVDGHNAAQPLFLYIAHQAVHSANPDNPIQAPLPDVYKHTNIWDSRRKKFAGVVSAMDKSIGELVDRLSAKNMIDNTVIFFSTDNGGPANGFDMNWASNWPLRGVKNTLWEGGVRGVGFVWSPLLKKPGRISEGMVHITDFSATILSLAGGRIPAIDGVDIWNHISEGDPSPRDEILINIDPIGDTYAIRYKDWKLIHGDNYHGSYSSWYHERGSFPGTMNTDVNPDPRAVRVVCGNKPIADTCPYSRNVTCLFNIANDPCEFYNLASYRHDLVTLLLEKIAFYKKTMVAPINEPEDPKGDPELHDWAWVPWTTLP